MKNVDTNRDLVGVWRLGRNRPTAGRDGPYKSKRWQRRILMKLAQSSPELLSPTIKGHVPYYRDGWQALGHLLVKRNQVSNAIRVRLR
ncbi:unnamed protein product, partial [Nesidiocoris tenuis]